MSANKTSIPQATTGDGSWTFFSERMAVARLHGHTLEIISHDQTPAAATDVTAAAVTAAAADADASTVINYDSD